MIVEIVLVLILIGLAVRGWELGVIEALGELVGAVLAFKVAQYASALFGSGIMRFVVFVLIALTVAKFVGWLFRIASKLLKIVTNLPLISFVNDLLGGILGFLGGVVLIGSTAYIIVFYRLNPTLMGYIGSSQVAQWCQTGFTTALRFLL